MLATIKTILRLLEEEDQLKSALRVTVAEGDKAIYNPYRTELFARLAEIKVLLRAYGDDEISIARQWKTMKARFAAKQANHPTPPTSTKPIKMTEDGFLRVLIFLYFLTKGEPMQAFIALSFGAGALMLAETETTSPKHRMKKI